MPIYALGDASPILPATGQYWLAPNACLIGEIALGEDVGIWFGAVLRGDKARIAIGARSNIQENCMLHADPGFPLQVGEDCTIGHHAILHGCTIGSGTLIGMGAIVLNGAKIGRGCLVGAGALVTEGKVFPENSLIIGAPAQVKRELAPAEIANNLAAARGYVENMRRFARELSLK